MTVNVRTLQGLFNRPPEGDRQGANDYYTQPGDLFRLMSPPEKKNTIGNIVGAMGGISGPKRGEIINRQLCHFFRADVGRGTGVAAGLGVKLDEAMVKELAGS